MLSNYQSHSPGAWTWGWASSHQEANNQPGLGLYYLFIIRRLITAVGSRLVEFRCGSICTGWMDGWMFDACRSVWLICTSPIFSACPPIDVGVRCWIYVCQCQRDSIREMTCTEEHGARWPIHGAQQIDGTGVISRLGVCRDANVAYRDGNWSKQSGRSEMI